MNLRLTPLNIVSSVLLVSIAYLLINADDSGWRELGAIPLLVMFALCFISDLVFRRLIPDIKRIWLFELLFLIFVAVLILQMKKAEIKLTIELDDQNIPESILWESTDSTNKEALPVKSMMLALWDHNYKNSLRIDLWTKDMPADEMKRFFYETLQTMGDSFLRATGEKDIVEDLRDYCAHFAEKMELTEGNAPQSALGKQ